ncbi:hypothetical protein [Rhizobium sp. RM]|uniref:hypothetical protein n=1 Tax=Rhizobium sp. RM TaxID=2748079 RepID=UPI00110DB42B|nr:hypothetical protein [Rhizobium sp. RM]NWJ24447.1 hypothetical protein [Rhizobium sp. RM]TMV16266.1 hypothetical protein BJG94_17565 [Rhizobium sp. Td3]
MKAFLRFLSFLFLAAAIVQGVFDSIRSVSTSSINVTGILSLWGYAFPASRAMVETGVAHYIHPEAWRWIENALVMLPAFAMLLALSLLCWMLGYKKHRLSRFQAI